MRYLNCGSESESYFLINQRNVRTRILLNTQPFALFVKETADSHYLEIDCCDLTYTPQKDTDESTVL